MISVKTNSNLDFIYNRVISFIEKIKASGVKIETIPGMKTQDRSNYKNRKNIPSASFLYLWSVNYDLSVDWLLTGEGEMLRADNLPVEDVLVHELTKKNKLLHDELEQAKNKIIALQDKVIALKDERAEGRTIAAEKE